MQVRVLPGYSAGKDVAVVTFDRRTYADRNAVTAMFKELCDRVEAEEFTNLVLDGAHLEYVASATLGKLMTLSRLVTEAGGALKLCSLEPQFHDILRTTRLNEVFEIYDDEETALASFKEAEAGSRAGGDPQEEPGNEGAHR